MSEQTDYRAIVERIAVILHGKVTDIDLLTVTVLAMKERNSRLERQRDEQPAPVVPDDIEWPAEKFCPAEYAGSLLWSETEIWNKAVEACREAYRAAMLGKPERVSPAYKLPSGWIKCSERMPPDETPVLVNFNGEPRIGEIRWDHPTHEESYPPFRYWD
ncbi:DUF551 domain-containing protein [Franconibacter daqui]|nr:DUF551 domain-containing protein [Franconibacter daqui]